MKLLLSMVWKDVKRNRTISITLAAFLILSAVFMAGGLRVAGTLLSSMTGLEEVARTPVYLQMHKGEYDEAAFRDFVASHETIEAAQTVNMLNIRNANITWKDETFEQFLMDNGFVIQNGEFDFLLDTSNEIAVVQEGEIGVPVYYAEELGIEIGDTVTVRDGDYARDFIVTAIVRDSLMNPALTSSKRFLISEADQEELSLHTGEWEYIFEFLLADGATTARLEADYLEAGMPSNGVALTGSAVTLLNALSSGLVAFIIVAISLLLISIAILCLSYIIRATMADETHTIGEMKAIGFPGKAIQQLYQMKYFILVGIAALIGYLVAIPFGAFFSSSVVMYYGNGSSQWMQWLFPLVGILLLTLVVTLRCRRIIRKNLDHSVLELMRGEEGSGGKKHYALPAAGFRFPNATMAFGELKVNWPEYIVILLVFVLSSFLILMPANMKTTLENPSFVTYMGVGESDIRIDIQYSDQVLEQKERAQDWLENDPEVERFAVLRTGYVQVANAAGEVEYTRVEDGDESAIPLEYLKGSAPTAANEIALSDLNAAELGKEIGDPLTVFYRNEELPFIVSGIYQDVTYGGRTAKAAIDFVEEDIEVYIIYLDVVDGVSIADKTAQLRGILTESKVTPISEFVSQTLGGISSNLRLIEGAAIAISLLLVVLVSVMFLRLLTARERGAIAIKKAIGLSNLDLRIQYIIRILAIQLVAIVAGTVLANTLGESLFGIMLSTVGASKITMLVQPLSAYLLYPAAQIAVVVITVILGTKVIRNIHIRSQILE